MHILICEDEHFIRRALAEHLSALGYQVSEVENGRECLEFVLKTSPDLILMDIQMPVMDGRETFRKLKEMGITIPIIVLSGLGEREVPVAGFFYIQKPYRLSEVSSLIQSKFGL